MTCDSITHLIGELFILNVNSVRFLVFDEFNSIDYF